MKRKRKATAAPRVLGDVTPGDWATLEGGDEVLVSWYVRDLTFVRPHAGQGEPEAVDSSTPITGVRVRVRQAVADGAETDPLLIGRRQG